MRDRREERIEEEERKEKRKRKFKRSKSKRMGFPRRRSLWLKVAVLATAVWITVCFLLYTEDRAAAAVAQGLAPSGVAAPPQVANGFVPPALPLRKETPGNVQSKAKLNQAGLEQGKLFFPLSSFFFTSIKICRKKSSR